MKTVLRKRISKIRKRFQFEEKECSLLLSSAPSQVRNRDNLYPYRQDSDFYYLTGSSAEGVALLISSKHPHPILFAPPVDKKRVLWDGPPENYRSLAKDIGAELIVTDKISKEIFDRLKGTETLFHQNTPGSISSSVAQKLYQMPSHERMFLPRVLEHTDQVMEELRLYKDPSEIKLMREAATCSINALCGTLSLVVPGSKESVIGATIDYWLRIFGCDNSFGTIAATGPSAATLHHRSLTRTLRRGEMILIDCGAEYKMYAGDLTRVFPVGGSFSPLQKDLYNVVLEAQYAALRKVKDGVLVKSVYDAAAKAITRGLVDLRVLRGKVSKLMANRAYLPYFPHGIGHTVGLDVHDIGRFRGNNQATLKAGMAFTIEPGIYFPKKVGKISPCGIRIEDTVVVTKRGVDVLTQEMPKDPESLEFMVG